MIISWGDFMPVSKAPYKRSYKHTRSRGSEYRVRCDFCKKLVPRYKTIVIYKRMNILNDPVIRKQVDNRMVDLLKKKVRICLACARFRGIVKPGISQRRKHLKR